jgi:hypothetical protein
MKKVIGAEGITARRTRLARAGVLRFASVKSPPELLEPSPVRDPEGKVLKALLEERRSRQRNPKRFGSGR